LLHAKHRQVWQGVNQTLLEAGSAVLLLLLLLLVLLLLVLLLPPLVCCRHCCCLHRSAKATMLRSWRYMAESPC
jgi:hypothetical protein